jgi:hypothetical protein
MKKQTPKKTAVKKSAAKKQTKNSVINLNDFSKDADSLFKTYKLETGIIVANHNEGSEEFILSCVNSPDQKEEEALLLATQNLFSLVSIKSEYFNVLTNILEKLRVEIEKKNGKKLKK